MERKEQQGLEKEIGPDSLAVFFSDPIIVGLGLGLGLGFVQTSPLVTGATKLRCLLYLPHRLDVRVKWDNMGAACIRGGPVCRYGPIAICCCVGCCWCPSGCIWLCSPPCLWQGPLPERFFEIAGQAEAVLSLGQTGAGGQTPRFLAPWLGRLSSVLCGMKPGCPSADLLGDELVLGSSPFPAGFPLARRVSRVCLPNRQLALES